MSFRCPHQYTVTGRGEFPAGMLRYDEADFASLVDEANAKHATTRRKVRIVGEVEPTTARWESFGWSVSDVEPLARKPK